MAVTEAMLKQIKSSVEYKGVETKMDKNPKKMTTQDMETLLELDTIDPIVLTPSDREDASEKADYFEKWYAEELRTLFEANDEKSS